MVALAKASSAYEVLSDEVERKGYVRALMAERSRAGGRGSGAAGGVPADRKGQGEGQTEAQAEARGSTDVWALWA